MNRRHLERRHLDLKPKFQAHHIDISERDFGVKDLEKLMTQTRKELDLMDQQRRDEFKKHEMEKELRRREKLKVNKYLTVYKCKKIEY